MSRLYDKLQSELNKVYGNTMLMEDDRGYDEYFCKECKGRVYEDEYNHKQGVCYKCWFKDEEGL